MISEVWPLAAVVFPPVVFPPPVAFPDIVVLLILVCAKTELIATPNAIVARIPIPAIMLINPNFVIPFMLI